jgi:hypothetical protein
MIDLLISLVLSALISVAVKIWFGESGLSDFPVLTFLVIAAASFFITSEVHALFFAHAG